MISKRSTMLAVAVLSAFGVAVLGFGSGAAFAHEHRTVGPANQYSLVVGWVNEPAFAGLPNAVDIYITRNADNKPIATDKGDAVALEVEVELRAGEDQKAAVVAAMKLASKPELVMHTDNRYTAWFKPVTPGAYAFHITGTISDASNPKAGPVTIDETFVCGKGSKGHHAFVCLTEPQVFAGTRKKS